MERIIILYIILVYALTSNSHDFDYSNQLRICQNNRNKIERIHKMDYSSNWEKEDTKIQLWKNCKKEAALGIRNAQREGKLNWEFVFLEQMYFLYRENDLQLQREYKQKKATEYAQRMIDVAVQIQNADTICIAISHYLFTNKNNTSNIDSIASNIKKKVGLRTYKNIACFTARQLATYKDTTRAIKFLREAMGTHLAGNSNEAITRRVVGGLIKKGNIREAAETYMGYLDSEKDIKAREKSLKDKSEENTNIKFKNYLLSFILTILAAAIIVGARKTYNRMRETKDEHSQEITQLKEDIETLRKELATVKVSEADNYKKIELLEKKIERIQSDIMKRLGIGKSIYNGILQNKHLPADLKGAEKYLLDYFIVYHQEEFNVWKDKYTELTPRMYTYLILSSLGKNSDEIEEILSISPSSLRSLKSRIAAKGKR